jgi:hypothetical protein
MKLVLRTSTAPLVILCLVGAVVLGVLVADAFMGVLEQAPLDSVEQFYLQQIQETIHRQEEARQRGDLEAEKEATRERDTWLVRWQERIRRMDH